MCDTPTRESVDNPLTRGIHVAIECFNATNECLVARDSNMSKNVHVRPIHSYSRKITNNIIIVSIINYNLIQTC